MINETVFPANGQWGTGWNIPVAVKYPSDITLTGKRSSKCFGALVAQAQFNEQV